MWPISRIICAIFLGCIALSIFTIPIIPIVFGLISLICSASIALFVMWEYVFSGTVDEDMFTISIAVMAAGSSMLAIASLFIKLGLVIIPATG